MYRTVCHYDHHTWLCRNAAFNKPKRGASVYFLTIQTKFPENYFFYLHHAWRENVVDSTIFHVRSRADGERIPLMASVSIRRIFLPWGQNLVPKKIIVFISQTIAIRLSTHEQLNPAQRVQSNMQKIGDLIIITYRFVFGMSPFKKIQDWPRLPISTVRVVPSASSSPVDWYWFKLA